MNTTKRRQIFPQENRQRGSNGNFPIFQLLAGDAIGFIRRMALADDESDSLEF